MPVRHDVSASSAGQTASGESGKARGLVRVTIVGAGMQGYVLMWSLARRSDVDSIVVADAELTRAQDVVAPWGAAKATAHEVDAGNPDLLSVDP